MIDFIGDIHGHADELEELLKKLGYVEKDGAYSYQNRKVLFVGDYIDRGPKIVKTLEIVKAMVDSGNAIALMGNHEYNAICFHYQDREGGHLRKHLIKNIHQHSKTLDQFLNKQDKYEEYIEWFKTLPLFYETEKFRVVHACWDNKNIKYLRKILKDNRLTDELIYESVKKGTTLCEAIDQTLKGKEMDTPNGMRFKDEDGIPRKEMRIKWWENPTQMTYSSISIKPLDGLPDQLISVDELKSTDYYNHEKIVFFGHYWLKGEPSLYRENICCLDYSVAKGGELVAYRFDEEKALDKTKLIYV